MGTWQRIDTAPKDGTNILVYRSISDLQFVNVAFYRSAGEREASGQYCGGWDTPEEWTGWWSYGNTVAQVKLEGIREPTHWMPLPPEVS